MILSTSTNIKDVQMAYGLHANSYVPKPGDLASLVNIGKIIEGFWLKASVLVA